MIFAEVWDCLVLEAGDLREGTSIISELWELIDFEVGGATVESLLLVIFERVPLGNSLFQEKHTLMPKRVLKRVIIS